MGLITQTNEQYYAGRQAFSALQGVGTYTWTGDIKLVQATSTTNRNYKIFVNNVEQTFSSSTLAAGEYTASANDSQTINIFTSPTVPAAGDKIEIVLNDPAKWSGLGSYEYISLEDVVSNFMVGYVGTEKTITKAKRGDVIFHAKRGLQEFSYDTLKSIKSQEVSLPPSLQIPIPQDYVNYTRLSWVDATGVQRTIYPANSLTMNPQQPIAQESDGSYMQDDFGDNTMQAQAIINERWRNANKDDVNGKFNEELINGANIYNWSWWKQAYGQRYGLDPELSQDNGWFTINDREGTFSFSSNISGYIIIEYISDGLAYDEDTKIPKMIEQAMYMHIAYSILSTRKNIPEYIVARFKKERRAELRNAKIRLQNLKSDQIVQVMRNKSKWIKH